MRLIFFSSYYIIKFFFICIRRLQYIHTHIAYHIYYYVHALIANRVYCMHTKRDKEDAYIYALFRENLIIYYTLVFEIQNETLQ
jgi:hypothetical protein